MVLLGFVGTILTNLGPWSFPCLLPHLHVQGVNVIGRIVVVVVVVSTKIAISRDVGI